MTGPIHSNWVVITGAPSSGKSSVIDVLARQGYAVQPEVARHYIEENLAAGKTLDAIRGPAGVRDMQETILARQLVLQAAADPARLTFLDRGVPDSFAYFRMAGLDETMVATAAAGFRYRAVFLFEPLPVTSDAIRTEDDAAAQQLGEMFAADYTRLGYDVIRVPALPVLDRANLILTQLGLPTLAAAAVRA